MPKNVVSVTRHYIRTVYMLTSNLYLHLFASFGYLAKAIFRLVIVQFLQLSHGHAAL